MSEGVCDFSIYSDGDGDAPEFYDEKIVTARKEHECCECRETIATGTRYRRASGKWEEGVRTYCFCLPCSEAAGEFFDDGGAYTFGVLWDEMESNWRSGAHLQACLNRLTSVAAKHHMRMRWMKWKGLEPNEPNAENLQNP